MLEALESIWGILVQAWDLIITPFTSLGYALAYLVNAVVFVGEFFVWLHPMLYACFLAVIVLGVIKFILAR